LPNNPILLGWSLGGLLAINIANKIKISQLILLASTPKFIKDNLSVCKLIKRFSP
jgi:pimeloyl-[acyl-carrier protein] methyl ester esterase